MTQVLDTHLLVGVVRVDVLDRRGDELGREFCRHSDGQRHPAFECGVGDGAVVIVVVVVADLRKVWSLVRTKTVRLSLFRDTRQSCYMVSSKSLNGQTHVERKNRSYVHWDDCIATCSTTWKRPLHAQAMVRAGAFA